MAVRYWVLVSDDLLFGDLDMMLPAGLRHIGPPSVTGEAVPGPYGTVSDAKDLPYMHWHQFEDDGAPPELEGKRVILTFRRGPGGLPEIAERRAAE